MKSTDILKEIQEMQHVFISYVRENESEVDRIHQELESHGITIWRDLQDIKPGERWKRQIRKAIRKGGFFIACFSKEYHERNESYMNEELTIAIERLRQLHIDRVWFIPIKLNDCRLPDIDIGRGETLEDLNYVDLYKEWDNGIQRIVNLIQPKSSEKTLDESRINIEIDQKEVSEYHKGLACPKEIGLTNQPEEKQEKMKKTLNHFSKAIKIQRDYVHGFIKLSERERDLIDTKVFQRLRRIRQLALTSLVYPGAVHTRFDHSVGVMHIAGRICQRLQELNPARVSDEDIDRVRFAALLHDVGQGPFSHVSEHLLKKYAPTDADTGQNLEKIHEKITVDIIQTDPKISEILDTDLDFVVEIIKESKKIQDWRRDIVSSELDADKMDYLLRDSYFAGVKYGQYDLEKLIESCLIVDLRETPLAISSKGIYALEQFLLARYHMTQQVYCHRVSLISNEMIIRGIMLAIDGRNRQMTKLYKYPKKSRRDSNENYEKKKKDFVQNYLDYHDEKVIELLRNCNQEKAREIFNQLYNGELFKMITEIKFKDETDGMIHKGLREMAEDPIRKGECEQEIAEYLSIDADYVIIKKHPIRDMNYVSQTVAPNPEGIMIFDEKQQILKFLTEYADELFLVRPATKASSLETVQVYAPINVSEKQAREIQSILRSV